jgi:hypothetical protein
LQIPSPGFQLTQEAHRRDGLSVHRGRRTPAPLRACKSAVTEATSGQESVESFVPARVRRAAENCRHFEAIESPLKGPPSAAPYQPLFGFALLCTRHVRARLCRLMILVNGPTLPLPSDGSPRQAKVGQRSEWPVIRPEPPDRPSTGRLQ